ncbi:NAD(P)-binding protein [bacterium]|nr:NAD(P)-binding protein [bacterium]
MSDQPPIRVAIVGGGCAAITTAFELTHPRHRGRYAVTVYQVGWRLGGKGASGRGVAGRIEEHGLHVWMGFYENAFRLLRECYAELGRPPGSPIADWRDAFAPGSYVGVAEALPDGSWRDWTGHFPPADGLPGDPLSEQNPFTVTSYLARTASLLRALLRSCQARQADHRTPRPDQPADAGADDRRAPADLLSEALDRIGKYGMLASLASLVEVAGLLETVLRTLAADQQHTVLRVVNALAANARRQLEALAARDDEIRRLWEVIDLALAIMRGIVRFGLAFDPRGFDAIDDYEISDWLRLNGASRRSVDSAFMRGLYSLALAYEDGDFRRPRVAAGQGLRGALRMFFTYRGQIFWKMRAGMGDVIFAPFYEVLKRRGVRFEFFHRLENVALADPARMAPGERPHVAALEFDVQATVADGEYQPLVDVGGLPCWPAQPDWTQLVDGERLRAEGWAFESFWDRRKTATRTLRVIDDFDFVVLGIGVGAVPHTCREILARDARWRTMTEQVKTVATQAFQIWMREDMEALGWPIPLTTISAFAQPFDTWADMAQTLPYERWPIPPRAVAYFCSVLPDLPGPPNPRDPDYPQRRRAEAKRNAIAFLDRDIAHLWPAAARPGGGFRWELLVDPAGDAAAGATADAARFDSQYWTVNVNPSDRYTLAPPGSLRHRISPLDNTYDNLTIAGDWTDCGFSEGCVEAAVMSGRLAAHAIAQWPPLEEIIGYDHP